MHILDKFSDHNFLKKTAVSASVGLAVLLSLIKTFGALSTGSLAILSSLIDSLSDVFASCISFIAVKFSVKPATAEHRYGYGHAESISALIQAAFVAGSGLFVMYDGINRFLNPAPLQQTDMGLIIMVLSLLLTLGLIIFQKYVADKTNSIAIKADSAHYTVDVLTNAAIIVSLLVVKYFQIAWFDTLTAFLISAYLIYNAYHLALEALADLTDRELDESVRKQVVDIILNSEGIDGFHDLRTRSVGNVYYIEIHLELDGNLTLNQTHTFTDQVEDKIKQTFPNAQVIIHQDPYGLHENRLDYLINGKCDI